MKRRGFISNHYGFTLIEIIAVLIILGILAAVAVPRYLDMTDDAHEAAVDGAISAGIGNYNLAFANFLAINKAVPTALTGFVLSGATTDVTIDGNLGDFTATYAHSGTAPATIITVTITGIAAEVPWYAAYIAITANVGSNAKDIPAGW